MTTGAPHAMAERLDELNLRSLRLVALIAAAGSVGRAATQAGLAQSAASRHLAQVEPVLGGALFHRTGRGVTPTPLGEQVLPGLQALLDQAQTLTLASRAQARTPSGLVTLGLVPALAGPLASALHGLLQREHPQIALQVRDGYSGEMEAALADGRVDLAVVNRYRSRGPHRYRSVCDTRLCVVARPDVLMALLGAATARTPRRLPAQTRVAALAGARLVLPLRPNALYGVFDPEAARAGIVPHIVLQAGSSAIIKRMLQDHDCASVLPQHAVADEMASGRLAAVPLAEPSLRQHIVLATSPQRPFTPAARVVAGLIPPLVLQLVQRGGLAPPG